MGNRNGGSRRKQRDNANKYSENSHTYVTPNKINGGNSNHRPYSNPSTNFQQHSGQPYSNGYTQYNGGSSTGSTQAQYTVTQPQQYHVNTNQKSNTSKIIFIFVFI
jgi:hypothetical protein